MGRSHEHRFWAYQNETSKYEELAEQYEKNIERDWRAYDYVTSRSMCPCLEYCNRCSFPLEGKVVRIKYRGENI
jgi:hypothetical protein